MQTRSKKALERAADRILGDSFKCKIKKNLLVNNPEYRAIPVKWTVSMDKRGTGRITVFMGGKGNLFLSIPFEVHNGICLTRKFAIKKSFDLGQGRVEEDFSLLPKDGKNMDSLAKTVNGIIDIIVVVASDILSKNNPRLFGTEQISLIPPYVFGIPKKITVQELSLEGLQKEGQLPMDLKNFRKI